MKEIESLLAKVLADELLSYEEKTRFEAWLKADPVNQALYKSLKQHWQGDALDSEPKYLEGVKKRFSKKLEKSDSNKPTANQGSVSHFSDGNWFHYGKVAAAVALFFVVAWAVLSDFAGNEPPNEQSEKAMVKMVEKSIPKGAKGTYTLSDGTKVRVNAGTKISFPKTFEAEKREVYLEGEAFFEVAEDASRPFVIYTGDVTTTVLGTSFNIHAYPKGKAIKVAVVRGKVAVETSPTNEVLLEKEQMAVYHKKLKSIDTGSFDAEMEIGWKHDVLVFRQASVEEITEELENWYGYSFEISGNKKLKSGYRGRFENASLKRVMESLSYSLKWKYTIDHASKTVVIH